MANGDNRRDDLVSAVEQHHCGTGLRTLHAARLLECHATLLGDRIP